MLESAKAKELGRMRRIESAEGLADLFFRADSVRSAKDESSTDNLRRTYRNWRTGSSDVHAHPDVLTFHHAATTDEQRSTAKMKRVKTTGDRLDEQQHEDLSSWSRPGSKNGTPCLAQAVPPKVPPLLDSMQPAAIPPEMRVPARGLLPVNISIPVKPSARARSGDAGGCPFVQGEMPPPPLEAPTAPLSGGCPFRQGEPPPQSTPGDAANATGLAQPPASPASPTAATAAAAGASSTLPPAASPACSAPHTASSRLSPTLEQQQQQQQHGAAQAGPSGSQMAGAASAVTAACNAVGGEQPSQEQMAAFQQAYVRILAEQKALLQQAMRQQQSEQMQRQQQMHAQVQAVVEHQQHHQPSSLHEQQQQAAAAQRQLLLAPPEVEDGGAGGGRRGAGGEGGGGDDSDADPDEALWDVIATSCAHGPLVTHPDPQQLGGMLASGFPLPPESWLYVAMQAEFGLPWAIGVNAEGQAYGRLEFKPKMQQWVLIRPTAADWQRLELGRLLPSMGSAWGSLHPPKSDARWICFPYLAAAPPCTLDLPALMAEGGFADAPLAAPAGPLVLMPEALEQRDVKSIGAKPPTKPSAPKQPAARGARKKKGGRDAEAEAAPRGAAAGGSAKRQRGSGGGGGSGDAMRDQRAAELLRPSASMEGLLQSLGVRQAFAGFGGGGGGGGNPNEAHVQQQQRGNLPPSSSLMQLLQALESQGDGDGAAKLSAAAAAGAEGSGGVVGVGGGSAQDLVNSPSIQSLLGLLRSSSAASLGHLGTDPDSRAASMLQLSSLAGQLAASPSAADLLGAAGEHLRRNGSSNAMLANLAALAARGGVGADGIAAAVAAAAPQLQLQSAGGGSSTADAARGGAGVVGAHGRGMDSAHMPPPAGTPIKLGGAVGEGEILGAAACLGMRESPSLTSLVDLVRNTSSTSLVDMINYSYSSTNLDAMDEAQQ